MISYFDIPDRRVIQLKAPIILMPITEIQKEHIRQAFSYLVSQGRSGHGKQVAPKVERPAAGDSRNPSRHISRWECLRGLYAESPANHRRKQKYSHEYGHQIHPTTSHFKHANHFLPSFSRSAYTDWNYENKTSTRWRTSLWQYHSYKLRGQLPCVLGSKSH